MGCLTTKKLSQQSSQFKGKPECWSILEYSLLAYWRAWGCLVKGLLTFQAQKANNIIANYNFQYVKDITGTHHQVRTWKKSEPHMGFEPTTLRDLVGCPKHWATGDSVVSKDWLELHHTVTESNFSIPYITHNCICAVTLRHIGCGFKPHPGLRFFPSSHLTMRNIFHVFLDWF